MKIDMHCHVHEGSIDSRISLDEYITVLKEKALMECCLQIMTVIMVTGIGNMK